MSITTFTIDGTTYTSYATVEEANAILAVDVQLSAAWALLQDDKDKQIRLIAATNRLDLLNWKGEKTRGSLQPNAWPRTGVKYPDGTDVGENDLPLPIEQACAYLAGVITLNPNHSKPTPISVQGTIKRVQAGRALVEYETGATSATLLPEEQPVIEDQHVQQLIQFFLASGSTTDDTASVGVNGEFFAGESSDTVLEKFERTDGLG